MREAWPRNVSMRSCKGLKEKEDSSSNAIGFREEYKNNKVDGLNKKEGIKIKDSVNNMKEELKSSRDYEKKKKIGSKDNNMNGKLGSKSSKEERKEMNRSVFTEKKDSVKKG